MKPSEVFSSGHRMDQHIPAGDILSSRSAGFTEDKVNGQPHRYDLSRGYLKLWEESDRIYQLIPCCCKDNLWSHLMYDVVWPETAVVVLAKQNTLCCARGSCSISKHLVQNGRSLKQDIINELHMHAQCSLLKIKLPDCFLRWVNTSPRKIIS